MHHYWDLLGMDVDGAGNWGYFQHFSGTLVLVRLSLCVYVCVYVWSDTCSSLMEVECYIYIYISIPSYQYQKKGPSPFSHTVLSIINFNS